MPSPSRFVQVFEARCSAVESQRERFDKAVALVNAARLRQETLNSCRDVEKKLLGDKLNVRFSAWLVPD